MSGVSKALVVSSNDKLRKELADTLRHHGMYPLLSSSEFRVCVCFPVIPSTSFSARTA